MNSNIDFTLSASGQPFKIPNGVVASSGGSLSIAYTINGAPAALTITVEGLKTATGDAGVLDSYVGTANTTRTINLSDTYDYFRVTATWTGGAHVSVGANMTSTGPGPTFSSTSLPAVQTTSIP
jgi:hypothetical protein